MQFLEVSAEDAKRITTYLEFEKARSEKI
jgi:hypothetical protein